MKVDLTDKQVSLIETVLGLDLDAMGLSAAARSTARAIRQKLRSKPALTAADRFSDAVKALKAMDADQFGGFDRPAKTPRYRHEDK